MTVENIMKLATVYGDARIETIYGSATKDDVQEERAALLAAVEELAKDAERGSMLESAVEEAMRNGVLPLDLETAYAAMKGQS